jgi:hypothetical protein
VERDIETSVRYMSNPARLGMCEAVEILTTLKQQTEADTANSLSTIKSDDQVRAIAAAELVVIMKDSIDGQQQEPQLQTPQQPVEEISTEELLSILKSGQ